MSWHILIVERYLTTRDRKSAFELIAPSLHVPAKIGDETVWKDVSRLRTDTRRTGHRAYERVLASKLI